ncbi:hypothetical protein [Aeromicrobium wangtongii]|uniref:Uncharacterized protein n=1 Tax=Aeromicrobium wangtongii TaxID=2969247 RepID=A0ABY5MDH5_9ACTN|nr:hypothetical protein [Aeromicrobium wangtongii]MCD9197714.1 hypothetical protein [Aeromicrobium wangtongii]UUP15198.1 hypothetical protein NQV15_07780 [Aeromicrobium wangtongii]
MPTNLTYTQLLEDNAWLRKSGDSFYFQCTTRTVQESKLFPVNPYIALSYYNAWYRWPELVRKISASMSPEEVGDRAREVSSYVNAISLSTIPNFFLGGRQFLIDMGMINPTDSLDDIHEVLDFSRRANLAYHRQTGHVLNSDNSNRAQILPERALQVFEADAIGCVPGDRLHSAVAGFLATASQYAFLKNCECRLGIHNSGPYQVGANEMLVRDFVDLAEGDYPWLDGVASEIEHNNLTMPVIMKDTHFNIVDDWGSFEATPSYDHDNVVAVGLYTSDYLSDGYIPVHMENAGDLADYLDLLREKMADATSQLWKRMAGWSRDQMIDAGSLVYYGVFKDFAHFAGTYEQDDWCMLDERANRMKPLMNDEYGRDAIAEVVGFISLTSQQESPYVMSRYAAQPADMWSAIPYAVLHDAPSTATAGPIRPGVTSLEPKTALYTTTRGKLTQDECNAAAKGFVPKVFEDGGRYLDDQWVKNNAASDRARRLYEATQEHSRHLQGRGSLLQREDIEKIRNG